MPPITLIFATSGLALWVIALHFIGVGAKPAEGSPSPLTTVGIAPVVAGVVDLACALYILAVRPAPLGVAAVPLAGLVGCYGVFFTTVGIVAYRGLDLRPVGNLSIAVAIVPLFWWNFFAGTWMFQSNLIVWAVAFLAVAATIYGRLNGRVLGVLLAATAIYTFFVPCALLALGHAIP